MTSSRVVFPAPLGPIRPYISPPRTTAVTSCRMLLAPSSGSGTPRRFQKKSRFHSPPPLTMSTPTPWRVMVRPLTRLFSLSKTVVVVVVVVPFCPETP